MPTKKDSHPRVVNEAMSVGLPTITTTICGLDSVIHGKTGFEVKPGDINEFKYVICKLLDPNLREKLGRESRRRIQIGCAKVNEIKSFQDAIDQDFV